MQKRNYIYADNAATTKLDPLALEAMLPFLQDNFANPSSLYTAGSKAKRAIKEARHIIAESICANDNEIFFTSGGTESNNWAIKGVARLLRAKGRHIITSAIEHHAVLNSCAALEEDGFRITYLPVDCYGRVSPVDLEQAISSETILVSIMLGNNEIGTIQDIPALSAIARAKGILFHTDAIQAVGHIQVDVDRLGVDLLSASAHKFNGPKGVGFLYKRSNIALDCLLHGGYQEDGLRAGTENVAGIIGMAHALKNNIKCIDKTTEHLNSITRIFCDEIRRKIPSVTFNGDPINKLPGHISLSLTSASGEGLLHMLDLKGISVSTGAACNSKSTEISHVLKAIGVKKDLAKGTIRISFGKDNIPEDVEIITTALVKIFHDLIEK